MRGLENAGQRRRGREAVADGGEVARAAAVEAQARKRPAEIGRVRERPAQGVAHRRRLDQELKRVEPPVDGLRIGQRAREPLGEQTRPGGGHGQVDRRQERAFARAAQGPRELEVGAGRRIDLEARPARAPRRRRERGPGFELGALDISQRQRGGGDLGAGERAEAVEGFDAIELAHPALGRRAIAAVARERRGGNAHLADDLGKRGFVVHRLRRDDLARLQPRDSAARPASSVSLSAKAPVDRSSAASP